MADDGVDYFLIAYLLLQVANLCFCCAIAIQRRRWVAVVFPFLVPVVSFIFALMLKARCPFCREYVYHDATVCPYCGRRIPQSTQA